MNNNEKNQYNEVTKKRIKKVFIVTSSPKTDAYSQALANAFKKGVEEANGEVDLLDLYEDEFNPCFNADDHEFFSRSHEQENKLTVTPEIKVYQERINEADAVVFAYPIYWWGFPAILKGFFDRVFVINWAYNYDVDQDGNHYRLGLLDKTLIQIRTGGSLAESYLKGGYSHAMDIQQKKGIYEYCGLLDIEDHDFLDILGDEEEKQTLRAVYIDKAYQAGKDLISKDRVVKEKPVRQKD